MSDFNPDWASPPGNTIAEIMRLKEISQEALAKSFEMGKYDVVRLLEGTYPIDEDLAEKLNQTLGGSKQFWINREEQYRETEEGQLRLPVRMRKDEI